MDKNIFICYARKDLDIIKGFLYDLNEEASNYPFKINAVIDKSRRVLSAGDRSKEKLQQHIRNSDGAVVFISNNFAESQFIKEHEIPEILAKKKLEPSYIITPIFIDKNVEVNNEILSFQSPNTEEEEIRTLTPGLRELIYKKNIKEIYEYFTEIEIEKERVADELETQRLFEEEQKILKLKEEHYLSDTAEMDAYEKRNSKNKSLRNIGIVFLLGTLVSIFGSQLFLTEVERSCLIIAEYTVTQVEYEETYIELDNKSNDLWITFLDDYYSTESYKYLSNSEQKELHKKIGVYEFTEYAERIDTITKQIASLGIETIHEDHVEMKRLILGTIDKDYQSLIALQAALYKYDEFINEIEQYYEVWDSAYKDDAEQTIKNLDDNFKKYDKQHNEELDKIFDDIKKYRNESIKLYNEFTIIYESACLPEST